MTILFFILIALASVILGFIVLVQNPKGGGLSGAIGGISNQFMGVKQTTDVLEKGTWIFSAVIGVLCLFSAFFFKGGEASGPDTSILQKVNTTAPAPSQPATQQAAPAAAADSNKK
ncbi:preprotein translocase subunit SecG [Deminuibacter soli]|uniref:Protein-export membrane protein SecG n=1 Tax=Deminuibacter soli TaxID=2291815 RepID=A0A3E1NJG3_9BACT|nr:preprotein translocase subunit SecG [Deminuibacter soli]RFM28062.1 preprotein translocase subunit SecG [Deminuibacter soli]